MTDEKKKDDSRFWRSLGNFFVNACVAILVAGVGVAGFLVSFKTVYTRARNVFGPDTVLGVQLAVILPIAVDGGIIALGILKLRLAAMGKSVWLVRLVEWILIGATIGINSLAGNSAESKVMHVILPVLYIFIVEIISAVMLKKYTKIEPKNRSRRTTISKVRWIIKPRSTMRVWLRVVQASIPENQKAIELKRLRQHLKWRTDHGPFWWIPFHKNSVPSAEKKLFALELAELSNMDSHVYVRALAGFDQASKPATGHPETGHRQASETGQWPEKNRPADQAKKPATTGQPTRPKNQPLPASRPGQKTSHYRPADQADITAEYLATTYPRATPKQLTAIKALELQSLLPADQRVSERRIAETAGVSRDTLSAAKQLAAECNPALAQALAN